jgi:Fe-S-cluster containining protein
LWFDEDTRQCKHYDLRPWMCRDFEMGSYPCQRWRIRYYYPPDLGTA